AITPTLAVSGGRTILLSTPNGARGFYWREWVEGEGWFRVRVPATECPRISEEFLAQEERRLGDWFFSQEYLCEFADSQSQIFRTCDVDACVTPDVKPLWPRVTNVSQWGQKDETKVAASIS